MTIDRPDTGLATKADVDGAATRLVGRLTTEVARLDGRLNLVTWMLTVNLARTIAILVLLR